MLLQRKRSDAAIERLSTRLCEIKLAESDSKTGYFSGYGAYFGNEDAYGDVIERGAFAESLEEWKAAGKLPPMLLQHGGGFLGGADDLVPVGKWDAMREDSKGLRVEGHLFAMGTDRGAYIYEGLKEGALDGLSIGFRTREARLGTKPGEPERTLTNIDLVEVSLVTFPANPKARVASVKTLTVDEMRDWTAALREEGLSRADAERALWAIRKMRQREAGVPDSTPRKEVVPDLSPQTTGAHDSADALLARFLGGCIKHNFA
jgi:hypothetical protein